MKAIYTFLLTLITTGVLFAQDQQVISDCTVTYNVSVEDPKADQQVVKTMQGATKILYIKGNKIRTDFTANGFKQTILTDSKSDSTIILREIGPAKYISYLTGQKLIEKNKKFAGIKYAKTDEKKVILGYECNKVIATLADGTSYNVYYTPSIVPVNKEYEYQFKNLPGFVLSYDGLSEDGKTVVNYTASKITLVPVPIATFDLPKSGYRVL